MAAVMRPAEARLSASTMIISSIRLSLVGAQVDCSTNTSWPRTFSLISTMISPSEKREHTARPSGMFRCCTTECASFGLALPENTIKLSDTIATISSPSIVRSRLEWLGRKDSNPRMAESKSAALTSLATPQALNLLQQRRERMTIQPAHGEAAHLRGQLRQDRARFPLGRKFQKYASA